MNYDSLAQYPYNLYLRIGIDIADISLGIKPLDLAANNLKIKEFNHMYLLATAKDPSEYLKTQIVKAYRYKTY